MPTNKSAYDMRYAKAAVKRVQIPFNKNNETDVVLLEWLKSQPNMVAYVKKLMLDDIERQKSEKLEDFEAENEVFSDQ